MPAGGVEVSVRWSWLPFAGLLVILPYPGTVAARLLLLLLAFIAAAWWYVKSVPSCRPALPCKPALMMWWVVCIVSLTYAVDPDYSQGELKNELGYTMMALFSFFYLGQDLKRACFVLRGLVIGTTVLSGWGFVVWASHDFVWQEGARHAGSGVAGTYVVTVLPGLVWVATEDSSAFWRRAARLAFGVGLLLAAISAQRAAWLAIAVQILLLVMLLARQGKLSLDKRKLVWGTGLVLIAFGLVAYFFILPKRGGLEAVFSDSRMAFWPQVVATIADHPLKGGGFGIRAMSKAYPELIPGYNTWLWHGHNVFLNYGLALGLPGIAVLVTLFGSWARFFWRATACTSGVVGLLLVGGVVVRNQFNDFFMRDMSLLFWALCGLFAAMALRGREGR